MRFAGRKMIAVPNPRSLHETPTSKGGGVAIVISWYIGITWMYFNQFLEKDLYFALLCGIFIAIISLLDDIYGVKPFIRFLVHLFTAIIAFLLIGGLRPLIIPEIHFNYDFIVYPIAVLGIVWFINLFNFMDGLDGFASVEAIFVSAVLFAMTWNLSSLLLIFCIGGFLCWNWPKAKIFMGDTGSTQLGFILVIMGIYFHNNLEFSILNWIMLTSPFWFDATLTLLRRWRNGENLSEGHRKHVYQRLVMMGYSHAQVNLFLILINVFIFILISIYREVKYLQIPLFVLTLIFYYLATLWVDRRVPFGKE